jgi:hypothetical protein
VSKLELIEPKPIEKGPDDLMDSYDVAKMLSVNSDWVNNHCTRTKPILPYVKFGTGRSATRRFRRSDIVNFIEENVVIPKPGKR